MWAARLGSPDEGVKGSMHLDGRELRKAIVVPRKLVNLVVG